MTIRIGQTIKKNRTLMGVSQEVLAEYTGVSVQAVSKWETGVSLPDITLLPLIAKYFGISMDELFFGESVLAAPFPDDNIVRWVQYRGKNMMDFKDAEEKIILNTELLRCCNIEIYGSADIGGDINGNVRALTSVSCGDICGNVTAGTFVNCGDIEGDVRAGTVVNCDDVEGDVSAGTVVNCENVSGSVSEKRGENT